jgi:lipoprotein-anchoring transpeptidase ErfK/SrfK
LGDGGPGDKERAGDHKTPEGKFIVCQKSVLSPADEYLGTRWMRLSYPNAEDASRGLQQGLIDKQTYNAIATAAMNGGTPPLNSSLGGGVGIHGGSTPALGSDWTWGCVGLRNSDVEEFYSFIKAGTPVVIQK